MRSFAQQLPDLGRGLEVIAPVAGQVHEPDQVPALQLADAVADVRARHGQRVGDLFGVHRAAGDVEQRVDLRDRAVHAPAGTHFAPVQDEAREVR